MDQPKRVIADRSERPVGDMEESERMPKGWRAEFGTWSCIVAVVLVIARIVIQVDLIAWIFNAGFLVCHLLTFLHFLLVLIVPLARSIVLGRFQWKRVQPSRLLLLLPAISFLLLLVSCSSLYVLSVFPSQHPNFTTLATGLSFAAVFVEIMLWKSLREDAQLNSLIESGEFDAALHQLQPNLDITNPKPKTLYLAGEIHWRAGRADEALDCYILGLGHSTRCPDDLMKVASVLYRMRRYSEGHALIEESLQIDADNVYALVSRCQFLVAMHREDEARSDWDKLKRTSQQELRRLQTDDRGWSQTIQTIRAGLNDLEPL